MMKDPKSLGNQWRNRLRNAKYICGSGKEHNTHLKQKMPKDKKNH